MVICYLLLYLILLETNTIDHPTPTVLILSSSIGMCAKKRTPETVAALPTRVLADLHETLDPAVGGGGHELQELMLQ